MSHLMSTACLPPKEDSEVKLGVWVRLLPWWFIRPMCHQWESTLLFSAMEGRASTQLESAMYNQYYMFDLLVDGLSWASSHLNRLILVTIAAIQLSPAAASVYAFKVISRWCCDESRKWDKLSSTTGCWHLNSSPAINISAYCMKMLSFGKAPTVLAGSLACDWCAWSSKNGLLMNVHYVSTHQDLCGLHSLRWQFH